MIADEPRTYLTGERAIERLQECAAEALAAHQATDTTRRDALAAALDASRQAIGYAMHAAHLVRKEYEACRVPE